ncbi:hypothetical protein ACPSX1_17140, partial [Escherichia coli]
STSKTPSYTKSVSWQHHRFLYWHICCYRRKLTDAELEACYRYDKQFWEHYSKKCRWPIRNVPWGASSVKYS